MAVTLTPLVTEVQTRCDALTNSSTVSEIIDAAIAAKKVAMADGVVNRTVLDAQIQRIINASGSGSLIEDLIALAASVEKKSGGSASGGSLPVGSMASFPATSADLLTMSDGSQWLVSGALVENDGTFDEAEGVDHLKVFGSLSQDTGHSNPLLASNGSGVIVSLQNGQTPRVSTDGGDTWADASAPPPGNSTLPVWFNDRFICHSSTNYLYYSMDGDTWVQGAVMPNLTNLPAVAKTDTEVVFAGVFLSGSFSLRSFRTVDGTSCTENTSVAWGAPSAGTFMLRTAGGEVYGISSTSAPFRYNDTTHTWTILSGAPASIGSCLGVGKVGSRTLALMASSGAMRKTDDEGVTWQGVTTLTAALSRLGRTAMDMVALDGRLYVRLSGSSFMLTSDDAGDTWQARRVFTNPVFTSVDNAEVFTQSSYIVEMDAVAHIGLTIKTSNPDANTVMYARVK